MQPSEATIAVSALAPEARQEWQAFLAGSSNGTLFHDLDFLDYHPPERFPFQHLVVRLAGKILAIVPGGVVENEAGRIFVSPLGASVGGPALGPGVQASQALGVVQALQDHARQQGWTGIDLTLPPVVFSHPPDELMPFVLFARGFKLANRWLCAMLDLDSAPAPRYTTLFRKRQAGYVRAAKRKGMALREGGVELLPGFLEVFDDTYTRHGTRPTHSASEIEFLLNNLPDKLRIYLAVLDDVCAAGILLFQVTPRVAYTFYICASTARAEERGNLFLYSELADLLAARGVRWLDLGPTCWDGNFNAGVTFFKESLGCVTHCRDRWSWRVDWTDGPPLAKRDFVADTCHS